MPYRNAHKSIEQSRHRRPLQEWLLRIGPYGSALLGISAIVLIWAGALYFTNAEKLQTEQSALHNADNLARAFEEQIIRSIRAADQTLLYARDSYVKDPENFDISLWAANSQFLVDFTFQVVIIGKDGRMIVSNIPGSKPGLDLSDREHFRIHAERQVDELFISKPVFGRVSQRWSIQLTRRITMPDGRFGGVVVVSLDPEYLTRIYRSIDIGDAGSITLVGADGIVRARGAKAESGVGQSLAGGALMKAYANAKAGSYASKSQLDGVNRLFIYRGVKGYPLLVVVGLAVDEVFKTYEQSQRTDLLIAVLLTLWLLGVTYLMARYQRVLAQSRDEAEAGTRARSEFLAMMSHEIRTPMNGVVGMSEVLAGSGLKGEQLAYAKTIRDSADHLLEIINDVLDFSKLEAGRVEIEQISFNLPKLVRGAVSVLSTQASDKGLYLKADIADDVPAYVVGDPAHLRQVILNLTGNGLKFTKDGGVTVAVKIEPGAQLGQARVAFAVSDTGMGIPGDGIPLLFREFSQLDSSIARRFGGTGLGLAICKRLVGLMGGAISVESEVGKGSTFRFTIDCPLDGQPPVKENAGDELPSVNAPSLAPESNPSTKLLLVEDNKTNQLVARKLLEGLGLEVEVANNGLEAVSACRSVAYDLVLMDVMMPEMDGLAATRAIRRLPGPHATPFIVALTANAQKHDRDICIEAGMDDFLAKPVTRSALVNAIARFHNARPAVESVAPATLVSPLAGQIPASERLSFDKAIYAELADTLGADDTVLVLRTFLADTRTRFAAMRLSARDQSGEAVKREAHAIKSSAATLGFLHLSDVAKSLERDALGLNWPALDARIDGLIKAFTTIEPVAQKKIAAERTHEHPEGIGADHGQ